MTNEKLTTVPSQTPTDVAKMNRPMGADCDTACGALPDALDRGCFECPSPVKHLCERGRTGGGLAGCGSARQSRTGPLPNPPRSQRCSRGGDRGGDFPARVGPAVARVFESANAM